MDEINNLLIGKCRKNINCQINSKKAFSIQDRLEIKEDGISYLTINSINLDKLINSVNIYKIGKLSLIFHALRIKSLEELQWLKWKRATALLPWNMRFSSSGKRITAMSSAKKKMPVRNASASSTDLLPQTILWVSTTHGAVPSRIHL
jgi:myosin heavy subunit